MPHRYLEALQTDGVAAARERYGSRTSMERVIDDWDTDALFGPDEAAYVAARDGFYLATTSESGWPYVQFRGGAPGFLHVLEPRDGHSVLAWADLRGNRQYLSVGNVAASPRVSLFLMDYAARRRLKILGTARVLDLVGTDASADPEVAALARRVAPAPGRSRPPVVERVLVVEVLGFDWNCPQHITPRWTREELAPVLEPLETELDQLRAENERLRQQVGRSDDGAR